MSRLISPLSVDGRIDGEFGYRSKAALNQIIRTLDHEVSYAVMHDVSVI